MTRFKCMYETSLIPPTFKLPAERRTLLQCVRSWDARAQLSRRDCRSIALLRSNKQTNKYIDRRRVGSSNSISNIQWTYERNPGVRFCLNTHWLPAKRRSTTRTMNKRLFTRRTTEKIRLLFLRHQYVLDDGRTDGIRTSYRMNLDSSKTPKRRKTCRVNNDRSRRFVTAKFLSVARKQTNGP